MLKRTLILLTLAALAAPSPAPAILGDDLASYVDPMIGTNGGGFVFPGPAAPYGMVQVSPDTEGPVAYTGYHYIDRFIRGFSHVHIQSMGVKEGGNLPFMPTSGPIVSTDVKRYQSAFDHSAETAEAAYYRVLLATYGIDAELTAGTRVAMHRYTFPPATQGNVIIDAGRHIPGGPTEEVQTTPGTYPARIDVVDATTVTGTANTTNAGPQRYAVHFAARFDRPFDATSVWARRGDAALPGTTVNGNGAGAAVTFDTIGDRDVVMKVGISFTSVADALNNLEDELPGADFDFEALRARTRAAWNGALGAIEVTGGTLPEKIAFTTAMYHAQHHPNVFSDADGSYRGYDGQTHQIGAPGDPMPAGSTYYANFSMWDTYRAEMPLLMLIAPDRVREMMRSLNAIDVQGGRWPRWGLNDQYADYMNGEPGLQVFSDAYCRGLVPNDVVDTMYAEARRLALVDRRDPSYLQYGHVPMDISGSGASATLEHASGDFALALVANARGEATDEARLLAQAGNWRNNFDTSIGFMRPKRKDGSWKPDYRPEYPDNWREGTGWQYTWLVPHDAAGLFAAMGAQQARDKLDTFFATALNGNPVTPEVQQKITAYGITYYGNQYAPSNEHDLQAPWLYNWAGEPWKTQQIQRGYQALYRAAPDGLPGNDDLGTMSAWFVWSALGFYPNTPGAPVYTMGSPMFTEARIRVPGGTFTVSAPEASQASRFIQRATLDGTDLAGTTFTHDAFAPGGTLEVEMSPVPDLTWGTAEPPPSMSTHPLDAFACAP